jgi:quercetin dioxygenase-like cupin family protein
MTIERLPGLLALALLSAPVEARAEPIPGPGPCTGASVVEPFADLEVADDDSWRFQRGVLRLPPRGCIDWHDHPVPAMAFVRSGEWTIAGTMCRKTYRTGQIVNAVMGQVHRDENLSYETPAEVIIYRFVYDPAQFRIPVAPPPTADAVNAVCVEDQTPLQ